MLPGTQVSSRARTRALFDDEQKFIAPGLQTIALLSGLAIDHGRGVTLVDLDGQDLSGSQRGRVGRQPRPQPSAVRRRADAQLEAVTVGSFTSRARAELVRLMAELAPGDLTRTQFFSGGAEAVEAAIRLARSYTKRTDIIGFTGRLPRQDGRRAPALRRRLEGRGRAAARRAIISRPTPTRPASTARRRPAPRRRSPRCASSSRRRPAAAPPRSSSSRCRARPATSCRPTASWRACTRSRASTARSSSPTR